MMQIAMTRLALAYRGASETEPDGGSFRGNLELLVPIVVAVLGAAAVALQVLKNAAVTRQIEHNKATAAKDLELLKAEEIRTLEYLRAALSREGLQTAEMYRHRQEQVLPFLSALSRFVDKSYALAYMSSLADVAGQLPHLQSEVNAPVHEVNDAMASMISNRAQLLLILGREDAEALLEKMGRFGRSYKKVLDHRGGVLIGRDERTSMWESHRELVSLCYSMMVVIYRAIHRPVAVGSASSDEGFSEAFETKLTSALESMSAASVPQGAYRQYVWTCMWSTDLSDGAQRFLERETGLSPSAFEDQLMSGFIRDEILVEFDGSAHAGGRERKVSNELVSKLIWVYIEFSSRHALRDFVEVKLPEYRLRFPGLWSVHRTPAEILSGLEFSSRNTGWAVVAEDSPSPGG